MLKNFSYEVFVPFIISLAMFMEAVDGTILNTAIPVMSHALSVNPIDLKIALISYLLSLAIFIPISGWMADKFGVKKVFVIALCIFTISSAWCGFSHNIFELVLARTLQGFGGSMTLPVGRLILLRTFPRHELIANMNRVIMVASIGLMVGPVLGGFITHYWSWPWIFWVNIPVGFVTILLALLFIKNMPPQKVPKLDKLGFILFGGSLALFTFGLSAFSETYIPDSIAALIMIIAVLFFIIYFMRARKIAYPIVQTKLFKSRTFRVSIIGNLMSRLGFGGVPFLLPLLLQIPLSYSPQLSGLLLGPTAIGVLLIKFFTLPILRFVGYKRLLILNTALVALSLWSFALIDANTSIYFIGFLTFLYGFLISLQYSSMNSLAYADIDSQYLSSATSIMSTMQQLAQSFGVAVGALLIRIFSPVATQKFILSTQVFHHTFFAMGILTLFSTLIFMHLKPGDGNQMLKSEKTIQNKF